MSAYIGNKEAAIGVYVETDRVVLSRAEYDALEVKDDNILYLINDDPTVDEVTEHIDDKNNPHGVTAEQIGAAVETHQHAAGDITSGILSVARGGTGVSSISALLTALGLDSTTKVVVGSYTGDNSKKRLISLDFTPNVVIIIGGVKYSSNNEYTRAQMCFKTSSISHVIGFTLNSNAGASYTRAGCNTNCLCATNGFYVGINDNAWSTTTTSGREAESTNYKYSYQTAYTYIAIG